MFEDDKEPVDEIIDSFPSVTEHDFFKSLFINNEKSFEAQFNPENEWQQEYFVIYNSYLED